MKKNMFAFCKDFVSSTESNCRLGNSNDQKLAKIHMKLSLSNLNYNLHLFESNTGKG